MQQIFSHGLIGAQREGELALRPGETARSLDEPMPQGVEFFKGPGGWPFCKRSFGRWAGEHLQLAR